jgi:hypothetical protein
MSIVRYLLTDLTSLWQITFFFYLYRTRLRTSIESIYDIQSSSSPIDILRRICEQCSITDIEYFDPMLCDGVNKNKNSLKKKRFFFFFI